MTALTPSGLGNALMGWPKLHAVSYDLNVIGQNYAGITARLEALGAVRVQLSYWWVSSYWSAQTLWQDLLPYIDFNDSLIVTELSGDVWGWENREDLRNWMNAVLAARRNAA